MDEKQLREVMDAYGDKRYHLELLTSERATIMDKILEKYPEAKREIEEAREELDGQIEFATQEVKSFRKILDMAVEQFARIAVIADKLVLKTDLLKVSFTNKGGSYDAKALDELVKQGKTELLQYRKDEGVGTRVELNKL